MVRPIRKRLVRMMAGTLAAILLLLPTLATASPHAADRADTAKIADVGLVEVDGRMVYAVDVTLEGATSLRLTLSAVTGQEIAVLAEGDFEPGTHRFTFDPALGQEYAFFFLSVEGGEPVTLRCACGS